MLIITTGGTIDKIYFDATSTYEVGDSLVPQIFQDTGVTINYEIIDLLRKDSLELTDQDRALIYTTCAHSGHSEIIITHGTDTMCQTASILKSITHKTIVLTGALSPARFHTTDAVLNLGTALGAAQSKPPGVYIAMSGHIFPASNVRKNKSAGKFESLS